MIQGRRESQVSAWGAVSSSLVLLVVLIIGGLLVRICRETILINIRVVILACIIRPASQFCLVVKASGSLSILDTIVDLKSIAEI